MASSSPALQIRSADQVESLARKRGTGWANGRGKRAFDVAIAAAACLVAAPLLGAIAAAIKCSSPGPVLFLQTRMGRGGIPFRIYKFRTMRVQDGPLVTARNDSRITAVGRILRRTKLDELPQLLNVLRGDMSFVGPRPKVPEHQSSPLLCRPGLTGAATLAFIEEETLLMDIPEDKLEAYAVQVLHQIKSDVDDEYALKSTLLTDLRLLASTALHLAQLRRSTRVQEMNRRILDTQVEAKHRSFHEETPNGKRAA